MSKCTAPIYGHRTQSGKEACPVCSKRGSRNYNMLSTFTNPIRSIYSTENGSKGNYNRTNTKLKPSWSKASSSVFYTQSEIFALNPIRQTVEKLAKNLELRDIFLCHAWDDRKGIAKDLNDLLESNGVSVWFSEKDVGLGMPLMRAIDKGLLNSRIGLVLVTPALLTRLSMEGIADKELSALLAREQLIPIIHNTTYEALRDVSPLLASRSGLSTNEDPLSDVVAKLVELVSV